MEQEYYTVEEAAAIMRCKKKDKIYNLCRSQEIKAMRFGRSWLIDKAAFDKWRTAQFL